jgi:hypothetical protein
MSRYELLCAALLEYPQILDLSNGKGSTLLRVNGLLSCRTGKPH